MERWIVIRENYPEKTGKPIAYMLCRYDRKTRLWYDVHSDGIYLPEDFKMLEFVKSVSHKVK